jgi:2-(1,2-epoxy-1,2-dihydrophenyl)acetyl-CoA isomerase
MPLIGADLIYMAEDAWLGFYFVKRAVVAEFSSSFVLPFLVGFHKAKELMYFGDKVFAHEAEKLGLVNKVLPSDELIPYVRKQALRLVPPNSPSLSLSKMKKIMHSHFKEIASKTLDLENQGLRELFKTQDFRAATKSLITKKDPIFKGK